MSARIAVALGLLTAALVTAAAQPVIPPSEMAGREHYRFIESAVERYMRPGPYVEPPLIDVRPHKPRLRKHGRRHHR
jgi:hypothetical protein